MQFYKIIISLLLLLTYSFGFAHNLVPHCSDFSTENHNNTHNHHSHTSGEEQNAEHNHITHNNHFDEGVYDYLVCLVHETETPESECSVEHCFTMNANDNSLKKLDKLQAIILFAVFQPIVQDEAIESYFDNTEISYLSPPIEDSPHRGPPVLSC